ncbi:MAG: hypothetical protein GY865_01670, partial [candidate division Zixibacteria bacterium]|nr:hypothetical protein [candidate division Zixibacteria bacterium]
TLILGLLANEDISVRNYNRGKDTAFTLSFLNSIGRVTERSATEIVVKTDSPIQIDDCAELEYNGGAVPLSLIISYLAGKNICCTLCYSNIINTDFIDLLVSYLNKYGIDIDHDADTRHIYFRSYCDSFMECKLSNALPNLKNCLLLFGLTSGQFISIKESVATDNTFEKLITDLGGAIAIEETKSVMTVDPNDPRKKIRIDSFDYKRKIELAKTSKINGREISVPSDFHSLAAFILLAILKKDSLTINDVYINDCMSRFIKMLKSFAADVVLSNKKLVGNFSTNTLAITGHEAKGRKLSGVTAGVMMPLTPYIAIAAAVGNGNTVIRDIAEYTIWQNNPFNEIVSALKNLDIKSGAMEDGLVIEARADYDEDKYGPFGNKETALAFYMLTLSENVKTTYNGFDMVSENYPEVVEAVQIAYENQLLSKST